MKPALWQAPVVVALIAFPVLADGPPQASRAIDRPPQPVVVYPSMPLPGIVNREAERSVPLLDSLAQLHRIAELSEQAGLKDEAAELRKLAQQMQTKATEQVAQRERRVQELERELAEVRTSLGLLKGSFHPRPQVVINVEVLEGKLADIGSLEQYLDAPKGAPHQLRFGQATTQAVREQVQLLVKSGKFKPLAKPTVTTTDGRPAHIHSGGEFPVPVRDANGSHIVFRDFGVGLEITPMLQGGNRCAVDLQFKNSTRDFANSVDVGGMRVPGLSNTHINTRFEMDLDQSAVLCCPRPGDRTGDATPDETTAIIMICTLQHRNRPGVALNPLPTY
jgi:hypothetical protein